MFEILKELGDILKECYENNIELTIYPNKEKEHIEVILQRDNFKIAYHKKKDRYDQNDIAEMKKFIHYRKL